jgi:WD40 repeat protein
LHERFDKHYAIDPRDYVRSIAFSHDGQTHAAGFLSGGVQLWAVDSMQQRHAFLGHYASVYSVAFSPCGQWLAFGNRDLQLWLKVILTEDEYAAVKAGEERALRAAQEREKLRLGYVPMHKK